MGSASHPSQTSLDDAVTRARGDCSIYVAVASVMGRPGIASYAALIRCDDKVIHSFSGSWGRMPELWVMMDAVQQAVWWLTQHLNKDKRKVMLYCNKPEYLMRNDIHPIATRTLDKLHTIQALLIGMKADWDAKMPRDGEWPDEIKTDLKRECERSSEDVLGTDAGRVRIVAERGGRFVQWTGRECGRICGKRYESVRDMSHLSYAHNGWGVQQNIIDVLGREGVTEINIILCATATHPRTTLYLTLDEFRQLAVTDTLREADGRQMFVEQSRWHRRVYGQAVTV